MTDEAEILRNPEFQKLLKHRSRWRWGFSIGLVGSYFAYIVAGIYIPETYAVPFAGSAGPGGGVLGYLLIALSIVWSVIYVRVINRMECDPLDEQESDQ